MSTWYIGPSGNDSTGNGSLGNPYATVSKCLTVGANGDTIKALTGTYSIGSTTNVNKQVTITSNSGVKTDVIFNANCTIFNLQESNITISYVTLQTSAVTALVTIDRMSTGTTVPTFWTGNSISNCNIKYVTLALELNGSFTVNNNTFTRQSGTNTATIMKIYSTRGTCSISSNTFTDSEAVQYIMYFTSTGSGTYLDRCNSKGGTMTIASNTITNTYNGQSTTFIFFDYFNQFSYGTVGADSQYNPNTRIRLNVNNNNMALFTMGKFIYVDTKSNSDYNTFGSCNINTNNLSNTDYGVIHLGKNTSNHNALTISSSDLNRSIFKLYSNTSNTVIPAGKILWIDAADMSTVFSDIAGTIPVTTDSTIGCIKSKGVYTNKIYNDTLNYRAGWRTNYVNGLGAIVLSYWISPVVRLVYDDQAFHINASLGFTAIVVSKTSAISNTSPIRPNPPVGDEINIVATPTNKARIALGLSAISSPFYINATTSDTRARIFIIVGNPATGLTKVYVDSTASEKFSDTYSSTYFNGVLGDVVGPYNNTEILCEWMIYDQPLTEATNPTLSSVASSLGTKWNAY